MLFSAPDKEMQEGGKILYLKQLGNSGTSESVHVREELSFFVTFIYMGKH